MKLLKTSTKIMAVALVLAFSSCEEIADQEPFLPVDPMIAFEEDFQIRTYTPTVESDKVTFRGNVMETRPDHSIKYGFMWYREAEAEPVVTTINVGQGVFTGEFDIEIANLPRGERLIVCAYLSSSTDQRQQLIGEEQPFVY